MSHIQYNDETQRAAVSGKVFFLCFIYRSVLLPHLTCSSVVTCVSPSDVSALWLTWIELTSTSARRRSLQLMQPQYSRSLFACALSHRMHFLRLRGGLPAYTRAVFACATAFLRLCGRSPFRADFCVCNNVLAFMRPVSVLGCFLCV